MRICTAPMARSTAVVTLGLLLCASAARAVVSVDIGSASGWPGGTASFVVSLRTTGEQVGATDLSIAFDPATPIVQCTSNPAFLISQCSLQPAGCTAGADCQQVRCLTAAFGSPIPAGVLYACTVNIAANATLASHHPLHCAAVDVRDTANPPNPLDAPCSDGDVQVVAAPTPTATPVPGSGGGGGGCHIAPTRQSYAGWVGLFSGAVVALCWRFRRRSR